ncbi:Protein kinase, putative [Hondaea fermentalgiana]|uniref:Protein kinase, putative n=1 Tax=Hondaea fermentalgiana TaxID=2315210 RepID=A0A2R5GJU1_9STRA|nr:Protein kinase, putative [Hondaea fermentalgiana]|eukprot:GBG31147.1 Protein kinase, putative [Hondaea fermentalgiana]
MDTFSGAALVLQLARDGASLLEDAVACKRKTAHLKTVLERLASHLEQLHDADIDATQLEAELRDLLDLLKPYFGDNARRGLAAKARLLLQAKAIRQALTEAEHHLQTCLQLCQLDLQLHQLSGTQQDHEDEALAEEAKDDEDARNDLIHVLEMLQERQLLDNDPEEVISLLQENPDIDIDAVLEGQIGSRSNRQALERLTLSLLHAEELEAASLSSDRVFIKAPLQVLGEGHFGQVVLGVFRRDDESEVETAIKRAKPNGRRMQLHEQQALMREAASWRGLEHANIVCLLGTCIIENSFHLVMDKCDMSLENLLFMFKADAASSMNPDDQKAVLRGVARGLEYLHSNLIVHRDLKPSNILLSRDLGLVKLANYGHATQDEASNSIADTVSSVGTSAYMAPEVLQAPARWTTRADIYAFGIVMWEVYHGKSPFEENAPSVSDLETRVLNGERPVITDDIGSHLWIASLMERCWKHDPQDRPRASDILRTLEGRTNSRRSTRLIRGLVSVFSRSRGGRNGVEDPSIELVQGLIRELSEETGNLTRTLDTLSDVFEQEYDAKNGDTLRAKALSRGILVSIKRILEHSTDPGILAKVFWVLRFVLSGSSGASFRAAAIQEHGLGSIAIEMFQAFRDHEDLQAAACGFVIAASYGSSRNCEILGQELQVGKEIVAAMRAHRPSESVQTHACRAVSNLVALSDCNQAILGQELNVGNEIVAAMREHLTNESVQINACAALWNLAVFNDRNMVILGQELGVGREITAAMREHTTNEAVQVTACSTLACLAVNDRNCVIFGQELKVGKEITAAMRAHPGSGTLQEKACSALGCIAANDSNRAVLVQELKVSEDIVAAMREHRENAAVQNVACLLLGCLADNNLNCAILGQELKVGKEIAAAMREHPTHEILQANACAALLNLADNDQNCVILGQELNVGKEIVAAMRAHPQGEGVQEKACGVLWCLAANDRNKIILGQELRVGTDIAAAMREHLTNESIQINACAALQNLAAQNIRNKVILGQELRVGTEIAAAMREHLVSESVQIYACAALWSLAANNDRNCVILGQELEVGKEILAVMRTHSRSEKVQEKACGVLSSLASNASVKAMLQEQGAEEAVQRTCERFPSLSVARDANARFRGSVS